MITKSIYVDTKQISSYHSAIVLITNSTKPMLLIELTTTGGPIYQQIVAQIKAACDRGDLSPGARLPTVQELAAQLGINRNTAAHAYRLLHV